MFRGTCVYMYASMCMYMSRRTTLDDTKFRKLEIGSFIDLELMNSPVSASIALELQARHTTPVSLCDFSGLGLGLQTFNASVLLTEPAPQPNQHYFLKEHNI